MVAAVPLFIYGLWLASGHFHGYDPRYYIQIGTRYLRLSHSSAIIHRDPTFHQYSRNGIGYDGQFAYFIAVDPAHAPSYGAGAYRFTRILYPMLARLFALGRSSWVPYTLLLINVLAIVGATLALAAWLKRHGITPWWALGFALYPGLFASLERDLNEPLCLALVALAIYLFNPQRGRRTLLAGLCFGVAALARETAVVFAIPYGLSLLAATHGPPAERSGAGGKGIDLHLRRRLHARAHGPYAWPSGHDWIRSGTFLALALAPALLLRAYIRVWLGSSGIPLALLPTLVPFAGIWRYHPWQPEQVRELLSVTLPGLICLGVAVWTLRKTGWNVALVVLIANALLFVVCLNASSYVEFYASGRISMSAVLAAFYILPTTDAVMGNDRTWLWVAVILWFMPWYFFAPLLYAGA